MRREDQDRTALATAIAPGLEGRPIALVGMMGAGKTAIGRRLAELLHLPFVDADVEIEAAAGKSISDIFDEHGEDYFRDGERRVIARLLEGGARVIATGGGAFVNPETRKRIRQAGISVWLKAELEVLMSRVKRRTTRPLIRTGDPEAVMRRLIGERHPIYAEADITVISRDVPHDTIVGEILEALAGHLALDVRTASAIEGGPH